MLTAATMGATPALMSWIPKHKWEGYNVIPPEVKERLYQGPFPSHQPENQYPGPVAFQYTTTGKQVINCFGMGLQTYISGDQDAPVVPPGKTLDQVIDELVSFAPSTKLYIRPCWKTSEEKRDT